MEITGAIIFLAGLIIGFVSSKYLKAKNQNNNESLSSNKVKELEDLIPRNAALEAELNARNSELNKTEKDLTNEREKHDHAKNRLAKAEEAFKAQEEKIETQKNEIVELHNRLKEEFENIANKVLRQSNEEISKINNEKLGLTLKPLGEQIKSFEEKIEKSGKEREGLKEQIKLLHDLNKNMAEEAKNLTKALKGDSKQQGNWGEIVLERILEESGLIKGQEYELEYSTQNQEGERIRPDAIIKLPDNKHVVVDSKVSLVAYEKLIAAEDEGDKKAFIKKHLESVKIHIKQLSDKAYQTSIDLNTPDFVLLFMPIEASFSVAVQADPEVFSFAWDKKIVIVSPTTLLATLRTISSIWKQERQTKNALEIARQSGAMYDKFVGFVEDMKRLDTQMQTTQKTYDQALNKLSEGKGNLISRAKNIVELGAKASKSLPNELLPEQEGHEKA